MQAFEYSCPTKIVCGAHALRKLADELRDHQVEKPLLLSDANLVKLGVAQHAIEPLEEAGVSFALFDQIPPDSSLDVVNEVVRVYTEEGCDGFVALAAAASSTREKARQRPSPAKAPTSQACREPKSCAANARRSSL